ncbi:MAG TPA: carbon-nitrogen hydrolase family protein [Anaerolineae bacterium]|nr:carbon-nitrogen hydrolase family protein [Anaerolineae bacterium]
MIIETVRVAAIQMNCHLADIAANMAQAETLLTEVAGQADIACLPELFTTGYNLNELGNDLFDLAEPVPATSGDAAGPTIARLCQLASQLDLAILAGLAECAPLVTGLLYDSVVLINRHGQICGRYRKSHLYPAEHRFFRPGQTLPVFELDGLRVGLAICFEAAFPPIFSTLALQGAQIVFNPSAVPVGYGYLQDVRTRARAQDNQSFVVAVNHVGAEGVVTYCGQSQIADPRGDVIALATADQPTTIVAELNLDLIRDQRLQEPILRGFQPDLYSFQNS